MRNANQLTSNNGFLTDLEEFYPDTTHFVQFEVYVSFAIQTGGIGQIFAHYFETDFFPETFCRRSAFLSIYLFTSLIDNSRSLLRPISPFTSLFVYSVNPPFIPSHLSSSFLLAASWKWKFIFKILLSYSLCLLKTIRLN